MNTEQLQQIILQNQQLILQLLSQQNQQQPAPIVQQQPAPVVQPKQRKKSTWQLYLAAHSQTDKHLYTGENHHGGVGHHAYNSYLKMKREHYYQIKERLSIVNNVLHINNDGIIIPYVVANQPAPVVEAPVVEPQPAPVVEAPVVDEENDEENDEESDDESDDEDDYETMEYYDNFYIKGFSFINNYDRTNIFLRYRYAIRLIYAFDDYETRQKSFERRIKQVLETEFNNNLDRIDDTFIRIGTEINNAFNIIRDNSPTYGRFNNIPKENLSPDEVENLREVYSEFAKLWNSIQKRKRVFLQRLRDAFVNVKNGDFVATLRAQQERIRREEFRQQQAELQANPPPPIDTHDDETCPNCIEPYGENGIHTCETCQYQMCNVCVEHIRAQPQWITPHQCPQCPQCRQNL